MYPRTSGGDPHLNVHYTSQISVFPVPMGVILKDNAEDIGGDGVPRTSEGDPVQAQFMRSHYMHNHSLHDYLRYILFADLAANCEFMKRFGKNYTILTPSSYYANGSISRLVLQIKSAYLGVLFCWSFPTSFI